MINHEWETPMSQQRVAWIEINRGEDLGGSVPFDARALAIVEKHGGRQCHTGWIFPDKSTLPMRQGRLVASAS